MQIQGFTRLQGHYVRFVQLSADVCVGLVSVLFVIGSAAPWAYDDTLGSLEIAAIAFGVLALLIGVNLAFGLCRIKLVMFNAQDIGRIAASSAVLTLVLSGVVSALLPQFGPLAAADFFAMLFSGSVGIRALAIGVLSAWRNAASKRERVAILGARGSGLQVATVLRQSADMVPVLMFDDTPHMQGMAFGGLSVHGTQGILELLDHAGIQTVLVCTPEEAPDIHVQTIETLEAAGKRVLVAPSYSDLLMGKGATDLDKSLNPDLVLGRRSVELDNPDIAQSYYGRTVMVTGAGGSIGSELCRQLVNCKPAHIVLFEHSEHNLYEINRALHGPASKQGVEISAFLGSVTERRRVDHAIAQFDVDVILHAAAYKHVPLVEDNEAEGIRNNVLGTKTVADAAAQGRVERFILVSTDKAVRPANVMGATKRVAELVVQDEKYLWSQTKFSIVRFGNVLGSSGSVLPLFQAQVAAGGPLTVTHKDVSRYFMTLTEAARLVLLSGAYSKGGDMFVLDMGRPQKIMDIARRVIELSGHSVRENGSRTGISIDVTGLRRGEKLHEACLARVPGLSKTENSKILRHDAAPVCSDQVDAIVNALRGAVENADPSELRRILFGAVSGKVAKDKDNRLSRKSAA